MTSPGLISCSGVGLGVGFGVGGGGGGPKASSADGVGVGLASGFAAGRRRWGVADCDRLCATATGEIASQTIGIAPTATRQNTITER